MTIIAGQAGIRQKILLRVTPGIDPHTYEAVSTGKVDSKFGAAVETGQAMDTGEACSDAAPSGPRRASTAMSAPRSLERMSYQRTLDIMLPYHGGNSRNAGRTQLP